MKRLFTKDNKGFSLVEILCALAIMSLVSVTIGTVVVVSSKTYRNGVSETTIQQEAQLAANTMGNIIKDASKVVYYEQGEGKLEDGVWIENYSGDTKLTVVTNKNKQYDFIYDAIKKVITYTEVESDASRSDSQLLASNIGSFSVDTTRFNTSRTITIDMEVTDTTTGKSIPLSYTMNSRNEVAGDVSYVEAPNAPIIIFLEDMACIVPGEGLGTDEIKYRIPVYVSGSLTETQLKASYTKADGTSTDGNNYNDVLKIGAITTDYVEVYVNASDYNKTEASYKLTLQTASLNEDGTPQASADCTVYVRSVTKVTTTYSVDTSASNNERELSGAVYKFTATVEGYNLSKFNRDFDLNYENGYSVYWSYEVVADGQTYKYDSSQSESNQYTDQTSVEKYIKIISSSENIMRPTLEIQLVSDMPSDFSLKVTATSKHAKGVNKACTSYATVQGEVSISKINDSFEVTLEPNETQTFDLGDMISSTISPTSNVTFKYYTKKDNSTKYKTHTEADGTNTIYKKSTNEVAISIGNDEIGIGYNEGNEPYTFYIGIYVDDSLASIIKVHVRRIDFLHVKIEDAGSDVYEGTGTVYHFKVRYNATTDGQNDMIIKYLINTTNKEDIENALAVNLSWAIKEESATDDVEDSDLKTNGGNGQSIIIKATIDEVVVKDGWSMASGIKDNQIYIKTTLGTIKEDKYSYSAEGSKYYAIIKRPMVRIYYADDAKTEVVGYSMVQAAELDIRLEDSTNSAVPITSCKHNDAGTPDLSSLGTAIGLSANKKLVVKAMAMHPYADYNRGHADYVTDIEHITDVYVLSQKNSTTENTTITNADGFTRGNDNFVFGNTSWPSRNGKYSTDKYPSGIDGVQRTVFRYREVNDDGTTSTWSRYYITEEKGLAIKFNGNNHESTLFLPSKSYDIEFANFVFTGTDESNPSLDDMVLIWPYNDSFRRLLGIKDGNISWNDISSVGETSWDEFAKTFRIGKVTVDKISDFGSKKNPVVANTPGTGDTYVYFALSNMDLGYFQNSFKVSVKQVENLDSDDNDSTEDSDGYVTKYEDSIDVVYMDGKMALRISQNASYKISKGIYCVQIKLKYEKDDQNTNGKFYTISGSTFKWASAIKSASIDVGKVYIKIE